jgi:hypothetical protein
MAGIGLKKLLCINVALLGIICGCGKDRVSDKGFIPVGAPSLLIAVPTPEIAPLKPRFAWTASPDKNASYDLVVCLGAKSARGFWTPGKVVYFRTGIKTTTWTIDRPLLPDTVYVWSVRTRSGKETSLWAAYGDGEARSSRSGSWPYNLMCSFKTSAK